MESKKTKHTKMIIEKAIFSSYGNTQISIVRAVLK